MRRNRATLLNLAILAAVLALVTPLLAYAQPSGNNGPLRRVLILHSFGREFAPFSIMSATFRTELARQSRVPAEFHEASIETARFSEIVNEQPVADYLQELFKDRRLDLIVAMGGPATLFVNRHREQLFPAVPVVATMDQRRVKESGASTNMTVVPLHLNLAGSIEDILELFPSTTNVAVVLGVSPFERYWMAQCQREFAAFTNRIAFTYLNELSLEAMTERVAALPPNSAIFYGSMVMDAAGIPHEKDAALATLHPSANAPIFGLFEHQLGLGILGGRLTSNEAWGRRTAAAALRILNGELPDQIKSESTGPEMPVYDGRELRRWRIKDAQLPPGSNVRFRRPTIWKQYKWHIIGTLAIFVAQAVTIAALLVQRYRRRLAEAAALENDKRMALAADAVGLGLWMWDISWDNLWVSDRGKQLFGYSPDGAVTLEMLRARVHPEDRGARDEAIQRALAGPGAYDVQFRVDLPDGAARWVVSRGHVEFNDAGEPILARGAIVDITERKHTEEHLAQHRNELAHLSRVTTVSELSSSLAHELNQPLAIILTNAQAAQRLLAQQPPDLAEARDILADIVSEDQRAGEVIRRLRSLLKPGQTNLLQLSVTELIEDVLRIARSDLIGRGIKVHSAMALKVPHVVGDRIQLQQVLLNLILNACDAMAANPPSDRHLTIATAHCNGAARISISDTGCGLPPDVRRIFEPFYTTKKDGLGLGLPICRSIATAHKGRLWAENSPAGGAVLHLELPTAASSQ